MRGLACILLISVHVVGDGDEGLRLPNWHILDQLVWFFQPLRMPLFAFISGLLFDSRADDGERVRRKLLDKAHRLLVPLLTVGTVFFVTRAAFHGSPLTDVWRVYLTEYDQFWYLTATFIVMAMSLAAAYLCRTPVAAVTVCWVVGVGLYLLDVQIEPNWFSITKAFYLAPFFFLGQLFRTTDFGRKRTAASSGLLVTLIVVIVSLVLIRQLHLAVPGLPFGQQGFGMLLLSLALCTALFLTRWNIEWLARIGPYSYAIFLFHLFFTVGSREFMHRAGGIANPYLLFGLGMLAGLAGPMLTQHVLLTRPSLAWAFLGQRVTKEAERTARVRETERLKERTT